jgi:hypothetical protein
MERVDAMGDEGKALMNAARSNAEITAMLSAASAKRRSRGPALYGKD